MAPHIAFFSIPAYGHMRPALAVAEQLVSRGHRVTFFTTKQFAPAVEAIGAVAVQYETQMAKWLSPGQAANNEQDTDAVAWSTVLFLIESAHLVEKAEAYFAGDIPDLIVYDMSVGPAGRALGHKWQRPAVQSTPSMASNRHYSQLDALLRAGGVGRDHPALRERRKLAVRFANDHGLTESPDSLVSWAAQASIVYVPRAYQVAAHTFTDDTVFVGPCLGSEDLEQTWERPADGRPLVVMSMGTTANSRPDFFSRCFEVFSARPWHVVMSLGGGSDPAALGPVPPNIEVHTWIPQLAVLRAADVFITAGGLNSVMMALYTGVPIVAVPQMPEAVLLTQRAAALGLGTVVPQQDMTGDRLCSAVAGLLGNAKVREKAARMRDQTQSAGGAPAAASVLEQRFLTV